MRSLVTIAVGFGAAAFLGACVLSVIILWVAHDTGRTFRQVVRETWFR